MVIMLKQKRGPGLWVLPTRASRTDQSGGHFAQGQLLCARMQHQLTIRIGDQAFRHLIVHTSLYQPVGNNTYLQLTGLPLCDLYEGKKKSGVKRKRARECPGKKKPKINDERSATNSKGWDNG